MRRVAAVLAAYATAPVEAAEPSTPRAAIPRAAREPAASVAAATGLGRGVERGEPVQVGLVDRAAHGERACRGLAHRVRLVVVADPVALLHAQVKSQQIRGDVQGCVQWRVWQVGIRPGGVGPRPQPPQ